MIQVQKIEKAEELGQAFGIRMSVFVVEQGVPAHIEQDAFDGAADTTHFLLRLNGEPCATARCRATEHGIKIERMAVMAGHRHIAAGKNLLLYMLKYIQEAQPNTRIYLHAQHQVVGFYARFGFVAQGATFMEADITHQKMVFGA